MQLVPLGMFGQFLDAKLGPDASMARVFSYLFKSFGELYSADGSVLPLSAIGMQFLRPFGVTPEGGFSIKQWFHSFAFASVFYVLGPLMEKLGQHRSFRVLSDAADSIPSRMLDSPAMQLFGKNRVSMIFREWMKTRERGMIERIVEPVVGWVLTRGLFLVSRA